MNTVVLNKGTMWESKLIEVTKIFVKDGIPICFYCGKKMKPWTPKKGKFKGQKSKYSFVCDCERYPRNMVISVG